MNKPSHLLDPGFTPKKTFMTPFWHWSGDLLSRFEGWLDRQITRFDVK